MADAEVVPTFFFSHGWCLSNETRGPGRSDVITHEYVIETYRVTLRGSGPGGRSLQRLTDLFARRKSPGTLQTRSPSKTKECP